MFAESCSEHGKRVTGSQKTAVAYATSRDTRQLWPSEERMPTNFKRNCKSPWGGLYLQLEVHQLAVLHLSSRCARQQDVRGQHVRLGEVVEVPAWQTTSSNHVFWLHEITVSDMKLQNFAMFSTCIYRDKHTRRLGFDIYTLYAYIFCVLNERASTLVNRHSGPRKEKRHGKTMNNSIRRKASQRRVQVYTNVHGAGTNKGLRDNTTVIRHAMTASTGLLIFRDAWKSN